MVGQTVAYVRESSAEQNLARQLEAVGERHRVLRVKISGSPRAKRTGLTELIGGVREGAPVKVGSVNRFSRDTRDLDATVDELTSGVRRAVHVSAAHRGHGRHLLGGRADAVRGGRCRAQVVFSNGDQSSSPRRRSHTCRAAWLAWVVTAAGCCRAASPTPAATNALAAP